MGKSIFVVVILLNTCRLGVSTLFNIETYFDVVHSNLTGNDWKRPKILSEGLCLVLYPDSKSLMNDTFFNKFFNGANKGRTLYQAIEDKILDMTLPVYIQSVAQRFASANAKNNRFDSQSSAELLLDHIKNATNLTGDMRNGLIHSYNLNRHDNICLFLAESLYYALEVQNNPNAIYIPMETATTIHLENYQILPWHQLISNDSIEVNQLSSRIRATLDLLGDFEIETFVKLAQLVITEEDGEDYLYAPITDDEIALYTQFNISKDEFLLMEECGLINMGARITNQFKVEYPYLYGFQNNDLALIFSSKDEKACEVEYKSYSITQAGSALLKIANIDTDDDFFIKLAKILKGKFSSLSIMISLFEVEDAINYEISSDIEWNQNLMPD